VLFVVPCLYVVVKREKFVLPENPDEAA
jgi:hypothetical protein